MLAAILCTRPPVAIRNFSLNEWRNWTQNERKERVKELEIEPQAVEVVADLAARQAEMLHQSEQQREEELRQELAVIGLEMKIAHLRALNAERQLLIDNEIRAGIQLLLENQDVMAIIALATVH